MAENPEMTTNKTPELRMTRVFDAPRSLVFEAWTKAEYVRRWFTPKPLTTPECEVDLRKGGVFRLVMRMPDGLEHPMNGIFLDVVPNERIVFQSTIMGDLEVNTTVTFADHEGGKTLLTVHQTYAYDAPPVRGAHAGWTATLDQLAAQVRELAARA